MKPVTLSEKFLLERGFELYKRNMNPDDPEEVWHEEWWLRLGHDKYSGNVLMMKFGGAMHQFWEIKKDLNYIKNYPLFRGYIRSEEEFDFLFKMFNLDIPAGYKFDEVYRAVQIGESIELSVGAERYERSAFFKDHIRTIFIVTQVEHSHIYLKEKDNPKNTFTLTPDLFREELKYTVDFIEQPKLYYHVTQNT